MTDGWELPADLAEQARRFHADGGVPVTPRRAATVVLLRDGAHGPEAFLVRRAASMAFASGMYAFPGGAVDPRDGEASPGWRGPSAAEWVRLLGLGSDAASDPDVASADAEAARAVVSAAVREVFEEAGVLLAGPVAGAPVGEVTGDDWAAARLSLVEHRAGLAELLAGRDLVVRSDLLRGWARWITPEFEPRRYDAFFFVAELPPGQRAREVGGEADRAAWMRPEDAVSGYDAGALAMLPPTVSMLAALRGFRCAADILAVSHEPLRPVTPRVVWAGSGGRLVV
ncbi:MAG TPA: NUDIX hydrolase [Actinocatenispora sp.]